MDELSEALDWRGEPVRCRDCRHRAIQQRGLCRKGRACIRDRRTRRIERFLVEHSALADEYLDHPYFEVRSVAAKYANIFRLPPLLNEFLDDPESIIRELAYSRLTAASERHVSRLMDDSSRVMALDFRDPKESNQ
jgi:hypothetical protein